MTGNYWGLHTGHLDTVEPALMVPAAIAAIVGLFAYEDAFVRAGQSVPLS